MAKLATIDKGVLRMRLQELAGQPVALYPGLKALGIGLTGASLLSQAIYWTERTRDAGGWFYKSQDEWEQEIGLSRSEQELARKRLVAIGVLKEVRKGVPCRLHYMVDTDRLFDLLESQDGTHQAQETCKLVCRKPAIQNAGNLKTSVQETCKQDSGKPASKSAGNPQTITENTTETTQEITAETTAVILLHAPDKPKRTAKPKGDDAARQEACRAIWSSYATAYAARYSVPPVRNAKVNRQVNDLLKRLGAEAAGVAEFFVSINDGYLIRNYHEFGSLLSKAESYRTQWVTGRQMNATTAQQIERKQANLNAGQEAALRILSREGRAGNEFLI